MTRAPLESSRLGDLKYAISPGEDVRPKNKSIGKCKKWHCATGVHGHCIADWFGQVWTSQNRREVLFFLNRDSHAVQIWPTPQPACSFLTVPRLKLYDPPKWWKQRFNWRKVWTDVKCNFSWEHFQKRYIIRKLSLSRVRMWNFTSIGPKTKKL